jgi:hypothetical protein
LPCCMCECLTRARRERGERREEREKREEREREREREEREETEKRERRAYLGGLGYEFGNLFKGLECLRLQQKLCEQKTSAPNHNTHTHTHTHTHRHAHAHTQTRTHHVLDDEMQGGLLDAVVMDDAAVVPQRKSIPAVPAAPLVVLDEHEGPWPPAVVQNVLGILCFQKEEEEEEDTRTHGHEIVSMQDRQITNTDRKQTAHFL